MTNTPSAPPSEWITKAAAAALLGVGLRQVEKRILAGYIEKRVLERLPTENKARVLISRADVEALLAGTPNQHGAAVSQKSDAVVSWEVSGVSREFPPPTGDGFRDLELIRRYMGLPEIDRGPSIPSAPRAWLTLAEAAEYSGLDEDTLREIVLLDQIVAIDRHGAPASVTCPQCRHIRISRASLDAFGEKQ